MRNIVLKVMLFNDGTSVIRPKNVEKKVRSLNMSKSRSLKQLTFDLSWNT